MSPSAAGGMVVETQLMREVGGGGVTAIGRVYDAHATASLSLGGIRSNGGEAFVHPQEDGYGAKWTSSDVDGGSGGHYVLASSNTREDGRTTPRNAAAARGRMARTRTMAPRAPTLPIIPSSRASPVLGPTKAGGLAGLGLLTRLSLAAAEPASDDGEDSMEDEDEDEDEEDDYVFPSQRTGGRAADDRSCAPMMSVVPLPPQPRYRGPLHPGASWVGTQRSGRASYRVSVTFTSLDLVRGVGGGYLSISQLTPDLEELVTYFDAQIVGDRHGFVTGQWGATEADDWKHWSRFPPFRTLAKPGLLKDRAESKGSVPMSKKEGDASEVKEKDPLAEEQVAKEPGDEEKSPAKGVNKMPFAHLNRPVVFMRWKERFVVPDHRRQDIQGASFAGFYYVCCDLTPPPELPPLSPPLSTPASAPPTRPQRSSSSASVTSVPDVSSATAHPYLIRSRQRSTSGTRTTTASPAPAPSPALPTVAVPPSSGGAAQQRRRRASTPGGFSYAAIARRNSSASINSTTGQASALTAETPTSPRPHTASDAVEAPKADEPASTQTTAPPPSLLSLDDFPPPSSPSLAGPPATPAWRPVTSTGGGEAAQRRRMSTSPLPSTSVLAPEPTDEPTSPSPDLPRGRSVSTPHHRPTKEDAKDVPTASGLPARGGWQDATITAYYCHANSEPYQELVLKYRPQHRGGSGDYQFA